MKLVLAALLGLGIAGAAGVPRPVLAAPKKRMSKTMYVCPKCGATSDKPGDCAKDKTQMEEAKFFCYKCRAYSVTDGKCPLCGAQMKPVDAPLTAPKK